MSHKDPQSIYIHIPFCLQKCLYCDFVSYASQQHMYNDYTSALCREISKTASDFPNTEISTIYFGGGTPTAIPSDQIVQILNTVHSAFKIRKDAEVTIESNPGIQNIYHTLKSAGFNRLSLGVQSLQDYELKLLGRIHSSNDVFAALKEAHNAGFANISIDLMYGIPGQTMESWLNTIEQAAELDIKHLSLYSLTVEEGTPFYWMYEHNELELPDEYTEGDMYEAAVLHLKQFGFTQYEISSFCKKAYICAHNLSYWMNDQYFGFGAAACSYIGGVRSIKTSSIQKYISCLADDTSPVEASECLPIQGSMGETVFLALRTMDGIDLHAFQERYGVSIYDVYDYQIREFISKGMLELHNNHIRLTHKGIMFSNDVFAEFV